MADCRFNGINLRNNPPDKIKDRAYVINLDKYANIGTHWIALYSNDNAETYLDSFGVIHIKRNHKIHQWIHTHNNYS